MVYGNVDDLTARLRTTFSSGDARPVAILAGSGLTQGAVPGVVEIITAIRRYLQEDEVVEFDERLAALPTAGLKYQAAFTFLSLRRAPSLRDRVIRICTLRAYKKRIEDMHADRLLEYESDVDHWELPLGVAALGRMWTGLPPNLRGPIVTTNFDPLCEVAIRKAGGVALPRSMDVDGSFARDVRALDIPQVVHIHGYWRESATLSMTTQLTQDRPALNGSIRALLSQHTLLVVGYGAWEDALTRQLEEVIREQSAHDLDVLWCYYGSSSDLDREVQTNPTLGALLQAPGNVQFYTDIDVNEALPALEGAIAERLVFPETLRRPAGRGSLLGWIPVAEQLLVPRPDDEDATAVLTFFDGRLPNWKDAASHRIPHRDLTNSIRNRLRVNLQQRQSTITSVVGASGEGKTTALMQVASSLATESADLTVLFNGDGTIMSIDEILSLPSSTNHLLVLDDAYRSIERLKELARRCQESGRTGIHMLIGSRDSDWSSVGGFSFAWSRYLPYTAERLRGMSRLDATAIVQSWEALGPQALGALADIDTTEERIQALEAAAADEATNSEGAFLGALLATRHAAGLQEHVRDLLIRLSDRPIHSLSASSEDTLLDAFFLIAVPHAARLHTLNPKLLSQVLDVSEQEIHGSVLLPLGDEAAVAYNADSVLVRHHLIAKSALDIASEVGVDVHRSVRRLVQTAVALIDREGMRPGLYDFAYLSQSLADPQLALTAARAAVEAEPRRLSYRTSLSRALRAMNDPQSAADVGVDSARMFMTADDASTGIRPALNEWGVAEGNLGNSALNAVLSGASIADHHGFGPVLRENLGPSIACLAHALRRLWNSHREHGLLNGLAGLVEITERLEVRRGQADWMGAAQDLAFRHGASEPRDVGTAVQWLSNACRRSLTLVEQPLPEQIPNLHFRFDTLENLASGW